MHTACTNIWFRIKIEFHVFASNVAVYLVAKNLETNLKESMLWIRMRRCGLGILICNTSQAKCVLGIQIHNASQAKCALGIQICNSKIHLRLLLHR